MNVNAGERSCDLPESIELRTVLDLVGGRWTLLILRELSISERRFSDLLRALPGVASNLLTSGLRSLEDHGLVERQEVRAPLRRNVYVLTELGRRVTPVLGALVEFGRWVLEDESLVWAESIRRGV